MEEARSSWNTIYQSKEGFECQVTLRDENEASLWDRIDGQAGASATGLET